MLFKNNLIGNMQEMMNVKVDINENRLGSNVGEGDSLLEKYLVFVCVHMYFKKDYESIVSEHCKGQKLKLEQG